MVPLLALLLFACGPDAVAWRGPSVALSVEPSSITFPATTVGASARMPVTITNLGDAAATLVVDAQPPFSADRAQVELGAGASLTLEVTFAPTDWADATGSLDLVGDPGAVVALVGPIEPDGDGDGADAMGAGGSDCDDADPVVFPGAADVCGDTVDSDCDPVGDDDCDADGFPVDLDCDDGDAAVNAGAAEAGPNGRDEDCDGRIDEVLAAPGELVLNELAPQAPAWIEVCNVSTRVIELGGFTVETTAASAAISAGALEPGACAAICSSELGSCAFEALFSFEPTSDTISLGVEGLILDAVTVDSSWDWEPGWVWSLDPSAATAEANDAASAWCRGEGTPGASNPACP
ncbi:MAG: MopE-related protein [Pseudomonadota bacterium]|nr:MopE-related protein [Pseudomonadota bacterium]